MQEQEIWFDRGGAWGSLPLVVPREQVIELLRSHAESVAPSVPHEGILELRRALGEIIAMCSERLAEPGSVEEFAEALRQIARYAANKNPLPQEGRSYEQHALRRVG